MSTIVIADDDEDILELLRFNLEKEGFEIHTVTNGNDVMPLAIVQKPQLIILDIMMPGKNGVEVCEQLRSDKSFDQVYIMFLTARSEDFTQIACYEHGGDDFIAKPVKPKVLTSRIKAILRRNRLDANDIKHIITIGQLSIDLERFAVSVSGIEIQLARKEYELLLLLSSKPGKLFSRKEIFNKVWGVELMIGDRTIDVHIRKLREKIGDELIKTVKGIGYKIVANDE
jgi:two-component system, OmpR family, alkaline phosphatase synthesis response regulator PhoP